MSNQSPDPTGFMQIFAFTHECGEGSVYHQALIDQGMLVEPEPK